MPPIVRSSWINPTHAFTLVELLAVIAIIGVLAALVIGGMSRVRISAKRTQCISNERQLVAAALLYAADNRGNLPKPYDIVAGIHPTAPGAYKGLITLLGPYTGESRELFYCTDAIEARSDGAETYTYEYQSTRTDGKRFNQIGYYWAAGSGGGWNPPDGQKITGSPKRVLITCVTINGYKGVHGGNVNMGFADGSVQSLKKTMNADVNVTTLELK
ncbi:MAG: type II secretion system protein [Opitutaceae bacterium]|jgi:prepilin-type N-terminal cleavage/methylation domain-containing protein/prepilin-type processing-associated H-X9-DG protein